MKGFDSAKYPFEMSKEMRTSPAASLSVITVLILVAAAMTVGHHFDMDEGVVLTGAWNIFNGRAIYEDFYQCQGPLSFYFISIAYRLLGPTYYAALFFALILLIASAWFLYLTCLQITGSTRVSLGASCLWIIVASVSSPLINHNTLSSFTAVFFLFFTSRFFMTRRRYNLFLAGLMSGITFFLLQTKGMSLILMIFVIPLLVPDGKTKSALATALAGALSVFLAGYRLWNVHPLTVLGDIAPGYLKAHQVPWTDVSAFLLLLGGTFFLFRRYALLNSHAGFLFCMQLALFLSVLNQPGARNLGIISFPLVLLTVVLFRHGLGRISPAFRKAVLLPLIASFLYLVCATGFSNYVITKNIESFFREMKLFSGSERFFAYPFLPNMYFELETYNPYYDSVLIDPIYSPRHFDINLDILKKEKPGYIFTNYDLTAKYGHSQSNVIDRYIRDFYRYSGKIGFVDVWIRT